MQTGRFAFPVRVIIGTFGLIVEQRREMFVGSKVRARTGLVPKHCVIKMSLHSSIGLKTESRRRENDAQRSETGPGPSRSAQPASQRTFSCVKF